MSPDVISWNAFLNDKAWVDLVVFIVAAVIQAISWITSDRNLTNDQPARTAATTAMSGTASGGITAVGILIPATLLVVPIGHPNATSLSNIFFGDLWFSFSLMCGLYVLWVSSVKVVTENVLNRPDVGIAYGLQLFSLAIGILRLLVGVVLVFGSVKS